PAARAIADNEIHLPAAVEFLDAVLRNGGGSDQDRGGEGRNHNPKTLDPHSPRKRGNPHPPPTSASSQHPRLPKSSVLRTITTIGSRAHAALIAEPAQILLLPLVARRKLEQPRSGAAKNVVLRLLGEKRQVPDTARQVEVPMRIIG